MSTILGLRIGIKEVGFSWLQLPDVPGQKGELVGLGTRIVPLATEDAIDFRLGRSLGSYQHRRIRKNLRVQHRRYKSRRNQVNNLLRERGLFPSPDTFRLNGKDLWALRATAARQVIPLTQLGRVIQHLSTKRGYLPPTDTNRAEGAFFTHLDRNQQALEHCPQRVLTVGEYICERMADDPTFIPRSLRFYRQAYQSEFETIWATQQGAYPDVLTAEFKERLAHDTLFCQRPHTVERKAPRPCRFEKNHIATPLSSPLYQLFSLTQQLNKLTLINRLTGEQQPLTPTQRELLLNTLCRTKSLTQGQILKLFKLDTPGDTSPQYETNFGKLTGDQTASALYQALQCWVASTGARGRGVSAYYKQYGPALRLDYTVGENGRLQVNERTGLFALWHLLYANPGSPTLAGTLMDVFGFPASLADAFAQVKLGKRQSNFSSRAIRRVLPAMLKGATLEEACHQIGYHYGKQQPATQPTVEIQSIPLFKPRELGNPVIEKSLNQALSLLNKLLLHPQYGPPDVIRIQIATEFRHSALKRQLYRSQLQKHQLENERVRKFLVNHFEIDNPPLDLFHRTLLYLQQDGMDLITGAKMPVDAVIQTESFCLCPIHPTSEADDLGLTNRVLTTTIAREKLGQKSIVEFRNHQSGDSLANYLDVCRSLFKRNAMPRSKWKLLTSREAAFNDLKKSWERNQNYVTEALLSRLSLLGCPVEQTYPSVTSRLMRLWNPLSTLVNVISYERSQFNLVEEQLADYISLHSPNLDHRRVAIEAVLIGCSSADLQQAVRIGSPQAGVLPWDDFLNELEAKAGATVVSHKVGKRLYGKRWNPSSRRWEITPRAELHGETRFGKINYGEGLTVVQRYPLNGMFRKVDSIIDAGIRRRVEQRLASHEDDPKAAFGDLDNDPLYADEAGRFPVRSVRCRTFVQNVHPLPNRNGQSVAYVRASGNHHAAIYRKPNGSMTFRVTSYWEAFQRKLAGFAVVDSTLPDESTLLFTLQPNDLLLVGLTQKFVDSCLNGGDIKRLSPHLFRVQKLNGHVIHLRHHASSTTSEDTIETRVRALRLLTSVDEYELIKVRVNYLGELMLNEWGLEYQ